LSAGIISSIGQSERSLMERPRKDPESVETGPFP
jgi:hypothetical protein